ncbi:MAG: DUF4174 domain-containing protein [Desulfobacterales bacterium]|jgi:hypothetical protein
MAKIIMAVMVAIVVFSVFGGKDALSMDLRQFQWKNRLLFLFTPQRSDRFFSDLLNEIMANKNEVEDRDLIVFEILESGPSFMDSVSLDAQTAAALREKFDAPPGRFTVILVGKDGGVKLKRHTGTRLNDIFALIDAMPMRQEEIRQKSQ